MIKHLVIVSSGVAASAAILYYAFQWKNKTKSPRKKRSQEKWANVENVVESTIESLKKQLQGSFREGYDRIYFRNEQELRQKLRCMYEDGLTLLQVISDFDRTLSKVRHLGKTVPSTHGILEQYPDLSEETKSKFADLRDTYLPIEFDPNLKEEEKVPYMLEWWSQTHTEIMRAGVKRNRLQASVVECGISLRDGAADFLKLTHRYEVPVLIFSAGIGNVIEDVLDNANCSHSNIQVAANYMTFDNQGDLNGFQGQLIHTFNKSASSCVDTEFCTANAHRRNVILLGDSTGDRRMADGAVKPRNQENILRIGFLNDKIEESLQLYLEYFDIVLVDDPTFEIPNFLLKSIVNFDLC